MPKRLRLQAIALVLLGVSGCVSTADRLVSVQGRLVDELGDLINGCEATLYEVSSSSDRYSSHAPVNGEFRTDFTTWAPTYSRVQVKVRCPDREEFTSPSYSVSDASREGINISTVTLKKRP